LNFVMKESVIDIDGLWLPCFSLNTLVIGSGAAALNAAVNVFDMGQRDLAVVTDRWGGGTSNNTGSDKQTYYKLSLSGKQGDSPLEMARDLFRGGSMHGDIALCEAQNSLAAFFHLVRLGVPFPFDRYGTYVGYKTDFDPRQRATSAGPLTSHLMFQALAEAVKSRDIKIFDRYQVVAILTQEIAGRTNAIGALTLDNSGPENRCPGFVVFNAVNIVLGTGGPAGMYQTSVYPEIQLGATGMALAAGAVGHNLTESQFGLASIKFRWNLSGTFQQVIPRYISTDQTGKDSREFLNQYFPDMNKLATAIFLKGYQWPFDPRKVHDFGSSLIDVLVYQETVQKGRRVFLDFTRNPSGADLLEDFSLASLDQEAYEYLEKSGALLDTPIKRLARMNQPAIDLYREQNIDISSELLEIAVCAQHNNGGLKSNIWWESNVRHLFPVGEVNGTHGVYRPGGSALNSGQVGGMRAALFISHRYNSKPHEEDSFTAAVKEQVKSVTDFATSVVVRSSPNNSQISEFRENIQARMTAYGAHIRSLEHIKTAVREAWDLLARMKKELKINSPQKLPEVFRNIDLCLTHAVYLEAISEYLKKEGGSRGSYLVLDSEGREPCAELGEEWRFRLNPDDSFVDSNILEISLDKQQKLKKTWTQIRPIPDTDAWFEEIWREFRSDCIIREDQQNE